MKRFSPILFASVFVLFGAGCTSASTQTSNPSANTTVKSPLGSISINAGPGVTVTPVVIQQVKISNFAFVPSSLSVAKGSTVTWTNTDSTNHTVTADDGSFDSGTIPPGGSFSFTASVSGPIAYHCAVHPMMKGTLTVN